MFKIILRPSAVGVEPCKTVLFIVLVIDPDCSISVFPLAADALARRPTATIDSGRENPRLRIVVQQFLKARLVDHGFRFLGETGAGFRSSLRFNSRSTAWRTKSVRSSVAASTVAMRANVPSGNLACISSDHFLSLPIAAGNTSYENYRQSAIFLI